jgi:hypothetical protein
VLEGVYAAGEGASPPPLLLFHVEHRAAEGVVFHVKHNELRVEERCL